MRMFTIHDPRELNQKYPYTVASSIKSRRYWRNSLNVHKFFAKPIPSKRTFYYCFSILSVIRVERMQFYFEWFLKAGNQWHNFFFKTFAKLTKFQKFQKFHQLLSFTSMLMMNNPKWRKQRFTYRRCSLLFIRIPEFSFLQPLNEWRRTERSN